jgi:hypothetical protein
MRVGTEKNPSRFERHPQLLKHAGKLLARNMEKRGVGENPIKPPFRQLEIEKVLIPDFTATMRASHFHEAPGALKPDRLMAELAERPQVTTGTAAKIQDGKGTLPLQMLQKSTSILAHVMILSALPKSLGILVIVLKGGS